MQKRKTRSIDTLYLIVAPTVGFKVCPECKKKFEWFGEQWVYRDQHKGQRRYFCSWTCWRKVDKKGEKLRGSGYHGD